jgi:hypothetical protein
MNARNKWKGRTVRPAEDEVDPKTVMMVSLTRLFRQGLSPSHGADGRGRDRPADRMA